MSIRLPMIPRKTLLDDHFCFRTHVTNFEISGCAESESSEL
jgi:hypothetical protein